jgi:Domain of unknown function (DUF5660)
MFPTNSKIPKNFLSTLETLRSIATNAKNEGIKPFIVEAKKQIGLPVSQQSGELKKGETIEIKRESSSSSYEFNPEREKARTVMVENERLFVEKRTVELRERIETLKVEVTRLREVTPNITTELEIASFQATDTKSYDRFVLKTLESIIEYFKSFRLAAEKSYIWLQHVNKRRSKHKRGNVWAKNVEENGSMYLRSGEHSSQRSAV